jgi:hypothetical protein
MEMTNKNETDSSLHEYLLLLCFQEYSRTNYTRQEVGGGGVGYRVKVNLQ